MKLTKLPVVIPACLPLRCCIANDIASPTTVTSDTNKTCDFQFCAWASEDNPYSDNACATGNAGFPAFPWSPTQGPRGQLGKTPPWNERKPTQTSRWRERCPVSVPGNSLRENPSTEEEDGTTSCVQKTRPPCLPVPVIRRFTHFPHGIGRNTGRATHTPAVVHVKRSHYPQRLPG